MMHAVTVPAVFLALMISACTPQKAKEPDTLSYVNHHYPNEFHLYKSRDDVGNRKIYTFVHKGDPNFILNISSDITKKSCKNNSFCQELLNTQYQHGKQVADTIKAVNETLIACNVPMLGIMMKKAPALSDRQPAFVVETPIDDTALTHLHKCLMPAYPKDGRFLTLRLIAPKDTPSPIKSVGIFDEFSPTTEYPMYQAYFGNNDYTPLDKLTKLPKHTDQAPN